MPSRLGPRFAIEAVFLVLVAVGLAFADLSAQWIVIVMGGAWLLTAVVEWLASRPRPAPSLEAAGSWPEGEVYAVAAPPPPELEAAEAGAASWPSEAVSVPQLPAVEEAEPIAPVAPEDAEPFDAVLADVDAPAAPVEQEPPPPEAQPEPAPEPEEDQSAGAVPAEPPEEQQPAVTDAGATPDEPAAPRRRFWRRQRDAAVAEDDVAEPPAAEATAVGASAPAVLDAATDSASALEADQEAPDEPEAAPADEADEVAPPAVPRRRFWRRRVDEAAPVSEEPAAEQAPIAELDEPAAAEALLVDEEPAAEQAPIAELDEPAAAEALLVDEEPAQEPAPVADAEPVAEGSPAVEEEAALEPAPEPDSAAGEAALDEEPRRRRFWRRDKERPEDADAPAEDAGAPAAELVLGGDAVEADPVVPVASLEDGEDLEDVEDVEDVEVDEAEPTNAADAEEELPEPRRSRFWRRASPPESDAAEDEAQADLDDEAELVAAPEQDDEAGDALDVGAVEDEPAFVNGDTSGALGDVKRSRAADDVIEPVEVEQLDEPEPEPDVPVAYAPEAALDDVPSPPPVAAPRLMRRLPQPREWTIWELERAIGEHSGDDPQRERQWRLTLFDLRRHANHRGAIPVELDPLVRETFADLIEPAAGS